MDKIIVGIAEGKVARGNQVLVSHVLDSCVGICLYDRREHIADMVYIILPERKCSIHWDNAYKFADESVHGLMGQVGEQGTRPASLIARVVGGVRMFDVSSGMLDMGQQSVAAVRERLTQEGTRLVTQRTGQNYDRAILFYAENRRLRVNTARHSVVVL